MKTEYTVDPWPGAREGPRKRCAAHSRQICAATLTRVTECNLDCKQRGLLRRLKVDPIADSSRVGTDHIGV